MIKALVIDDEPYAREELMELLHDSGDIEIIGSGANAIEGLKMINLLKPEVVFLDIQMPQITGIELLSMLDPDTMPKIVFVTAYDDYAIKAFEDNAFDYLLKPVEPTRLAKTLAKLKRELRQPDYTPLISEMLELIPCSGHNRILLLSPTDIELAHSDLSGVHIVTKDTKATTQLTLKVLEEKTPLIRCHRQYLVHPQAIREIKLLDNGLAEITTQHGQQVPVSRRYLKEIKDRYGLS
ncbi:two-component system response regulator BtsR [Photobacterium salinisoli]|uniref:two-component system response regulator BtsR n=1 Tax=Photobacterium salinisoli TaxID=1616783 RepID=UPI000EA195A2|nr:two-component system response regulator BtsR [Photobacterium salinisoli]